MSLFNTLSIIGLGFIGGSIAKAARNRGVAERVVGYGRNPDRILRAQTQGLLDEGFSDLPKAAKQADLLILCCPVQSFIPCVEEIAPHLKGTCLVTDAGSVKGALVEEVSLKLKDVDFVGAHPIAGGEKTGWEVADQDLFQGARCIVTPLKNTDEEASKKVQEFWRALGMEIDLMDPYEHDRILGAVSHLPHVVAFALMNAVSQVKTKNHQDVLPFASGGLRDTTRIAASDAVMWRDICLMNREEILDLMDQFGAAFAEIRCLIEKASDKEIEANFSSARENRLRWAEMKS